MAQLTAVQWFIEKTTESGHLWLTDKPYGMDELDLIIEAAKQMEKEQIVKAYKTADQYTWKSTRDEAAEQYYNETYGKQ